MGAIVLVLGGARSGKSGFALEMAARLASEPAEPDPRGPVNLKLP